MDKKQQRKEIIRKLMPAAGTLLVHAIVFLMFAINFRNLGDLIPRRNINDVMEFIEFEDLSGGDEKALPQLPVPPVPDVTTPEVEKIETPVMAPVTSDLPDDFTAEVPAEEKSETDSFEVFDVEQLAGQWGYGNNPVGIGDYKLPTFLGQNADFFHLWFEEHFVFPPQLIGKFNQRVLLVFLVDRDGSLTQVSVRNCNNELIAQEISRVVKSSPRWDPAVQRGKKVEHRVQMAININ